MELNWKFQGGGRVQTKKPSMGGGMDIFWNHTSYNDPISIFTKEYSKN